MENVRTYQCTTSSINACKCHILGGFALASISQAVCADPSADITIEEGVIVVSGEEITSDDINLNNYGRDMRRSW